MTGTTFGSRVRTTRAPTGSKKDLPSTSPTRSWSEDIGTKKGPPLYSAGALVAFSWDVKIRVASSGGRVPAEVCVGYDVQPASFEDVATLPRTPGVRG